MITKAIEVISRGYTLCCVTGCLGHCMAPTDGLPVPFSVTCVKFLPKSHLFWTAGKDGKLKQWDADKFERIQVLSGHTAEIHALTVAANGRCVALHWFFNGTKEVTNILRLLTDLWLRPPTTSPFVCGRKRRK